MKGYNSLELNEATMIEAMQEYLDKRMSQHAPRVSSVKSSRVGLTDGFTVTVAEKAETKA